MSCLLHPTYFPNVFHFAVIQAYKGEVTWEVNDHFQKQTFRNRCEICTDSGKLKLSAPIVHKKKQENQKFSEVELEYKTLWYRIHWKSIITAYSAGVGSSVFNRDFLTCWSSRDVHALYCWS